MSVKMRTLITHRFGTKAILPGAGLVEISSEGEIEVSNETVANEVEAAKVGFLIVGGEKEKEDEKLHEALKPKTEENDLGKADGENNDIGGEKDTDDETAELIKMLEEKSFEELRELAMPFSPKKDWKDLDQKGLITYLSTKLKK